MLFIQHLFCMQNPHQTPTAQLYTQKQNAHGCIPYYCVLDSSCVLFVIISYCPWGLQMNVLLIRNNPPLNTHGLRMTSLYALWPQRVIPFQNNLDAKGFLGLLFACILWLSILKPTLHIFHRTFFTASSPFCSGVLDRDISFLVPQ